MAYKFVNTDQLDADLTAIADAIRTKGGTSESLAFPSGMVSAVSAISTGVELNFEIVDGTTQPASSTENTIWVNTDVPITIYIFSAKEPEAPAGGMVWITIGTESGVEFNALKKNGLQVYPISAKQYVNGAWVEKAAKSYQYGEWVDWVTYLYKSGKEFPNLTGGFSKTYSNNKGTATLTKNADNLYLRSQGSTGSGCNFMVYTGKKINLTDFSTLCARIAFTNTKSTRMYFGVHTVNTAMPTDANYYFTTTESTDGIITFDVSAISGDYYVGIGFTGAAVSNVGECYVYEVYLK